jgi:hypothetical protein
VRIGRAARGLAGGGLATYTVPGSFDRVGGAEVIRVEDSADTLFGQFRNGSILRVPSPEEIASVNPADVRVTVLNGAGVDGLAGQARDLLISRGYPVAGVGNSEPVDATVVRYPPGQEAEAQRVANEIPGTGIEESSDVDGITLVLGPGAQLDAAAAPAPTAPAPSGPGQTPAPPPPDC